MVSPEGPQLAAVIAGAGRRELSLVGAGVAVFRGVSYCLLQQ